MTPCCSTVTFCGGCGSGLESLALKHFIVVAVVVVVVVSDVFNSCYTVIYSVVVVVVVVVAVVNSFTVLVKVVFTFLP
jgi:hypothetical protein